MKFYFHYLLFFKGINLTLHRVYTNTSLPWTDYVNARSGYGIHSAAASSENATYTALSFGNNMAQSFWDRSSDGRIIKVQNGKVQWIVGSKNSALYNNGDFTVVT